MTSGSRDSGRRLVARRYCSWCGWDVPGRGHDPDCGPPPPPVETPTPAEGEPERLRSESSLLGTRVEWGLRTTSGVTVMWSETSAVEMAAYFTTSKHHPDADAVKRTVTTSAWVPVTDDHTNERQGQ